MKTLGDLIREMVRLFVAFVVLTILVIGVHVMVSGPAPITVIQRMIGQVLP